MKKTSSDRQDIIRDTSFFSGSVYIAQAMFFIRGFLNARILEPSLYGLWSALNIILNYSTYVHLGSLNAMNREIPYQNGRNLAEGVSKVKDVTFTICLVASFVFSFALLIIAFLSSNRLPLNETVGLMTVAFMGIIFSLSEFYQTSLIAIKRFMLISKTNVIFSVLSVLLTLTLVPKLNIYGVYLVAALIPLVSILYVYLREPQTFRLRFDIKEITRLIKIGFPLVSKNFLGSTVASVAGLAVLSFLGKANMGYYSVGMLAGRFLTYFPNSIHRTFEPHIYQRYGQTQRISDLKKYLFKPTLVMSLLFPVLCAFYYTAVVFIIRHFLPKYIEAIYPFFVAVIGMFFMSFAPTSGAFITAINKQKLIVPIYLVGIAIVSLLSLVFINMGLGITGVSCALLVSSFFIGSATYIYAISHYMNNLFKCLVYLLTMSLPIVYMTLALIINEVFFPSSGEFALDLLQLFGRFGILTVFAAPLLYIADLNTRIVSDLFGFLYSKRFALRNFSVCAKEA